MAKDAKELLKRYGKDEDKPKSKSISITLRMEYIEALTYLADNTTQSRNAIIEDALENFGILKIMPNSNGHDED